eukprot:6739154-Pyramimonas_sp.AAC.1
MGGGRGRSSRDTPMGEGVLLELCELAKDSPGGSCKPGRRDALNPARGISPTFPKLETVEIPKDERRRGCRRGEGTTNRAKLGSSPGFGKVGGNLNIDYAWGPP